MGQPADLSSPLPAPLQYVLPEPSPSAVTDPPAVLSWLGTPSGPRELCGYRENLLLL